LPHYFNREGDLMAQKDFFQLAPQLGFNIVRVQ
jgi:hypothetical protein